MERKNFLEETIKHLDLERTKTIGDLVEAMRFCSFQARSLAHCFDVYRSVLSDSDRPTIFFGLAGAMVPGGMRKIVVDMIGKKLIDVLVTTGANLYHDVCEAHGVRHYVGSTQVDDVKLKSLKINRIYDTFADDIEFLRVDEAICALTSEFEPKEYSCREYLLELGLRTNDDQSILHAAAKYGVPIFCPALSDSSIGIALTKYYLEAKENGMKTLTINQIRDNYEIAQIKMKSKRTGMIFVGGGVPKNYVQQLEVLLEVLDSRRGGHDYAIQITTDKPFWGGLSGATFEEAQSWGKISKSASKASVIIDATIGLPLLVGAVLQKCGDLIADRPRLEFVWEEDRLREIRMGSHL